MNSALRERIERELLNDAERADLASWREGHKHPHRIRVEQSDGTCSACGETPEHGNAVAAVIDDSGGIGYCFDCVTKAYEVMKAAQKV